MLAQFMETSTDCMKKKGLVIGNIIGMGFDGAATFSGRYSGVQALLNKNPPHSIFVHCHYHLLQLACVEACKQYSRYQTCLHNINYILEILSLFTQMGWIST